MKNLERFSKAELIEEIKRLHTSSRDIRRADKLKSDRSEGIRADGAAVSGAAAAG